MSRCFEVAKEKEGERVFEKVTFDAWKNADLVSYIRQKNKKCAIGIVKFQYSYLPNDTLDIDISSLPG